ncbi:MAG: rhomboid family intramembrane serine protease [Planctomycetota bacterium]|nr:rhomboid family intramembrane serine protease [Planctomycetota bacterium]
MLIPYGTDRPLKRPTLVTYALVLACVAVFVVDVLGHRLAPGLHVQVFGHLRLDPERFRWWGLFTYQFLHADLMHLAGNMVFLYVFGANVEDRLGRLAFLAFYLIGGAAAGAAHCVLEAPIAVAEGVQMRPAVEGASGAIAAVTGAYMVLFPKTTVRVFSFFIILGTFHIPAWWLICFAIAKDVWFQGFGGNQGVALWAHLGGYGFGISVSLLLLAVGLLPREPNYDLFSLGKHAHRRRMFKELTSRGGSPWNADAAARPPARLEAPTSDREKHVLERRAAVTRLVQSGDLDGAARAYLGLLGEVPGVALGRDAQLALANHFFSQGDHINAAAAYELFAMRNAADRETPGVRLLIAIISGRYLNDPVRAGTLLRELDGAQLSEEQRQIASNLREELGGRA